MKQLVSLIIGLLIANSSFSQGNLEKYVKTPVNSISMIDRYGVDYELKEYDFAGDSSILELIDIDEFEHLRVENAIIDVYDLDNEVVISLYSLAYLRKLKATLPNE